MDPCATRTSGHLWYKLSLLRDPLMRRPFQEGSDTSPGAMQGRGCVQDMHECKTEVIDSFVATSLDCVP